VQILSALVMSALLGLALTACVSLVERATLAGGKA
jgi:ABC-type nitrate/sulfonate/bicarbonate transport system permease component